jgi:hypothetical protein
VIYVWPVRGYRISPKLELTIEPLKQSNVRTALSWASDLICFQQLWVNARGGYCALVFDEQQRREQPAASTLTGRTEKFC